MKDNLTTKSRTNYKGILILLIGGIAFTLIGGALIFNDRGNYVGISLGGLFLTFGIYCFYEFLNFDNLIISKDKLIIKSIYGRTKKTIYLKEIIRYNEIEKENASHGLARMKWKDLILFTKTDKYKISSTTYNNYEQIKKPLINRVKRDVKSETEWNRKNGFYIGIGSVIFGVIFSFFTFRGNINEFDFLTWLLVSGFLILFFGCGIYLVIKNKKPVANTS